jgi:hypothetical protein
MEGWSGGVMDSERELVPLAAPNCSEGRVLLIGKAQTILA